MAFKISKITDAPVYDSMPVAQITNYPLEKRDYRPFAQNILCVGDDSLFLRMWAFEVSPAPSSALRCVLYPFENQPETAFFVTAYSTGDVTTTLLRDGAETPYPGRTPDDVTVHPFSGEDLQGVYWGNTVKISLAFLRQTDAALHVSLGDCLSGNFYKLCDDAPFVHQGCFFPADFTGNPYDRNSMGDFLIVAY